MFLETSPRANLFQWKMSWCGKNIASCTIFDAWYDFETLVAPVSSCVKCAGSVSGHSNIPKSYVMRHAEGRTHFATENEIAGSIPDAGAKQKCPRVKISKHNQRFPGGLINP